MKFSQVISILEKQLHNNFMLYKEDHEWLVLAGKEALAKVVKALSYSTNKYFNVISVEDFDPFNSVQYMMFLYWMSYVLHKRCQDDLSARIYYLNKMLNCVELFYAVELPNIFICDHPLGSVMGRAQYSDFFSFSQGCTVGNNKGIYPVIGKYVTMMSDSKIIGKSVIGDNCIIAANAYIKDSIIEPNSIVFGQSPNLIRKPLKKELQTLWKSGSLL